MKHKSAPVQLPDSEDLQPLKPAAQQLRGWKILLLWLPAACDLTGTTVCCSQALTQTPELNLMSRSQLMNIGLLYTPVSIYQMTRGALVLFVGVLSVIFLRRRLWLYQFSLLACLFFLE
jgi:drug/metabolite transporter (DMT)-like permease